MSDAGRDAHIAVLAAKANIVSSAARWFYRGIGGAKISGGPKVP